MVINWKSTLMPLVAIMILLALPACGLQETAQNPDVLTLPAGTQPIVSPSQPVLTPMTPEQPEPEGMPVLGFTPQPQPTLLAEPAEARFLQGYSEVREQDGATIIFIPPGEFMMGCDPDHNAGFDCIYDETPLHAVVVSAYFIDQHEVTNGQYQLCVQAGSCQEPVYKNSRTREFYFGEPAYADYPVIAVTWYEASTYCQWVGGRLPTEAEWEKAARGSQVQAYPWGDQLPDCSLANSYDNASGTFCVGDTTMVGSYPAGGSIYGVMDMAGNVWEWVNDWYSAEYYRFSPLVDPMGIDNGVDKVIRGGAYDYSWIKLRIAYKSNHHPNTRHLSYGFRCVNPIESGVP